MGIEYSANAPATVGCDHVLSAANVHPAVDKDDAIAASDLAVEPSTSDHIDYIPPYDDDDAGHVACATVHQRVACGVVASGPGGDGDLAALGAQFRRIWG